jgi:hypothetical protein
MNYLTTTLRLLLRRHAPELSTDPFFAYFSRELGGKAYLCIRKIKNTGLFKPYAIIDQKTFDAEIQNLRK